MVDEALGFVDITCSELARLREWTPAEFQRNVESVLEARRLWARREITKTTLGDVIKAAGFSRQLMKACSPIQTFSWAALYFGVGITTGCIARSRLAS